MKITLFLCYHFKGYKATFGGRGVFFSQKMAQELNALYFCAKAGSEPQPCYTAATCKQKEAFKYLLFVQKEG